MENLPETNAFSASVSQDHWKVPKVITIVTTKLTYIVFYELKAQLMKNFGKKSLADKHKVVPWNNLAKLLLQLEFRMKMQLKLKLKLKRKLKLNLKLKHHHSGTEK